jgi:flagellar protein FliS
MSYGPDASKEYLRSAVLTASPEQLQLMLLDGAIRFTTRGLEALRQNQLEAMFNAMDRAQRIALELGNGLRREANPQLFDQMVAVYDFVFRRLVDATMQRDAQAAEEALKILRHQRETWAILAEKVKQHPQPEAAGQARPGEVGGEVEESRFVAEG